MKIILYITIFFLIFLYSFLLYKETSNQLQIPIQIQEPMEIIKILMNKKIPDVNMDELYDFEYDKERNQWCFKFGSERVDDGYFLYIKDSNFKSIDILLFPPLWDKIDVK